MTLGRQITLAILRYHLGEKGGVRVMPGLSWSRWEKTARGTLAVLGQLVQKKAAK